MHGRRFCKPCGQAAGNLRGLVSAPMPLKCAVVLPGRICLWVPITLSQSLTLHLLLDEGRLS